ncbi:MAG: abortive infection family protein [Albidovulum sp.]|uniref:abortive infection family protein n=1 Tax=Albidovulum sp. TaxID=1872424 RepID=UPI001327F9A6|nr:abortive infection family protein [Defluviimonas sp.]KAB2885897.1 MAG: abortive infection family protein [Defluviimonas sp.]
MPASLIASLAASYTTRRGTIFLRNKKSSAHGRTETQIKENELRPRDARLVIHSAHTLAAYVIECMAGN